MSQITRTSAIILNDTIENVFQLFTAKGEEKWVPGWNPEYVFPKDGSFVENQVFKTKSGNNVEKEFHWVAACLNKKEHTVIYAVSTENRVWTVKVQCVTTLHNKTEATITYTFTALNIKGETLNAEALEKMFQHNLKNWETAINHYLEYGTKIDSN